MTNLQVYWYWSTWAANLEVSWRRLWIQPKLRERKSRFLLANRKVPLKNNSHLLVLSCLSFHFSDTQFGENSLFANVGRSVFLRTEYIDWRNNCLYSLSRARDEYPAITRYQTRSPYYSFFGQDSCRTSHDSMTPWNPQPQFCKM